jgi:H+/gluconate symporter-like permease
VEHPAVVLLLLALFAALVGYLAEPRGAAGFARVFLAAMAFFMVLMGLGAVFGKTLGDFLRNAHG